jgi:hypothetical protein
MGTEHMNLCKDKMRDKLVYTICHCLSRFSYEGVEVESSDRALD